MYQSTVEGKGGIYAKVVSASISSDIPIFTLELHYPRFIHSEFMTHRMFSRNASSSRAIPVAKMVEQVKNDPAMPIHWGKNQPGMQANQEIEKRHMIDAKLAWNRAAEEVCEEVEALAYDYNVHKQIANRLLEPFQFITVVVTATEWDNFFALRLHPDAQPEIQELARCMKEAMDLVEPTSLEPGEWHLPYITEDISEHGHDGECYCDEDQGGGYTYLDEFGELCDVCLGKLNLKDAIKASVARCARVSYLNHDKSNPDIKKDLELADRLLEAGHMSPFEHQATPMKYTNTEECYDVADGLWWEWEECPGITSQDRYGNFWSGNFRGWIQYRQIL
jgi:thymidylate synthase ThyX